MIRVRIYYRRLDNLTVPQKVSGKMVHLLLVSIKVSLFSRLSYKNFTALYGGLEI